MKKPRKTKRTTELEIGPERELIEGCVQALREQVPVELRVYGFEIAGTDPRARQDARAELKIEGRACNYVVEVKHALREQHVGPILHRALQLEELGERLLVCTTRVPRDVGQTFRENNIAYLDLGGNAFLRDEGVYIHVVGRRNIAITRGPKDLTGTDIRLLGVFLRDEDAGEVTLTELAERAGVAIGAVGKGRERLVELRVLERAAKKQWRVVNREEGLRRFAEGWATKVRHKLKPRGFRMLNAKGKGDLEQRAKKKMPGLGCLLGGERAAAHMVRFLKTDHATLHVVPGTAQQVAGALLLAPDENGPIVILDRYGRGDEQVQPRRPAFPLAHPLLVWAECMVVPDERVAQVARVLSDKYLMRTDD